MMLAQHPTLDIFGHISNTEVSNMANSSTPVASIAPTCITPSISPLIHRMLLNCPISPTTSLEPWVDSKDRLHLDCMGGLHGGTGEDRLYLLNRGLRVLRHEGGSDRVEVRVEVHEEDVLVLLVSDSVAHGLEAHLGSLEGLDIEVNRLGGVLGGGVEDPPGINPGGHDGGLELLLKISPKLMRGGLSLEHGLVLLGDLEVDEAPGKLVLLQPLSLIISCLIRLLLTPRHNIIQVAYPKEHIHLIPPLEPVVRGEGSNPGSQSGELFSICGHGECRVM